MKTYFLIIIFSFLFTACSTQNKKDSWSSFIFPDKNNTKRSIILKEKFINQNTCKNSSKQYIKQSKFINAKYICSLNCSFNKNLNMQICEKTYTYE